MVTFQQFADFTGEEVKINFYYEGWTAEANIADENIFCLCSPEDEIENQQVFAPKTRGIILHTVEEWTRFLNMDITVTPEEKTIEYYVYDPDKMVFQICITRWVKKND